MPKPAVKAIQITKVNEAHAINEDDILASEEPLGIKVNYTLNNNPVQKNIAVTMRNPGNDFELALGFLYTEKIINSINDIDSVKYCEGDRKSDLDAENSVKVILKENIKPNLNSAERNFYITGSCGICGKSSIEAIELSCPKIISNHKVSKQIIFSLPEKLKSQQTNFKHTGGIHAAGLFNQTGELLLLREDIGRHNAVDKLIGAALQQQLDLSDAILQVSGRASFELLQKTAIAGIPVFCAIGAPSSLAVELATEIGITLIGFSKDNKFNCYSHKERITDI
jgi:FdhD protein